MIRKIALTLTLMLVCVTAYGQTQPQITSVEKSVSSDTLVVTWNGPGINPNGELKAEFTQYRLEWRRTGADWDNAPHKIINKHAVSIRLTELQTSKAYAFRLKAEGNDQGWGWSDEKEGTTSAETPQTIIEAVNEDGVIEEFQPMGKNPSFKSITLRGGTLEKDRSWGGIDIRQFVRPGGRDLRVKSLNGDSIARDSGKFYLRMMTRAEFVRLGWGSVAGKNNTTTIEDQWNVNRRQEPRRHPFFWTLRHAGESKKISWGWVDKPTEAWFRISVNMEKCRCGVRAGSNINAGRNEGVDGAMYFMVMQIKVKRPGKDNAIHSRIPFAVSLGGDAPQAPSKPHQRKLATTWGQIKSDK